MGSVRKGEITAILTVYRRPEYLVDQVAAIRSQSIPAKDIFVWRNWAPECGDIHVPDGIRVVESNANWKYHARFALGLLAQTEYVCIFDDDALPGKQWFQNCLETMRYKPGIMGTNGIRLNSPGYDERQYIGCMRPNENAEEVDIVGHSWFLRREWLRYLWYEDPICWENGEDIQLAWLAQRYGRLRTIVPPHPRGRSDLWGSMTPSLGADGKGSYQTNTDHLGERDRIVKRAIDKGWRRYKKTSRYKWGRVWNRCRFFVGGILRKLLPFYKKGRR